MYNLAMQTHDAAQSLPGLKCRICGSGEIKPLRATSRAYLRCKSCEAVTMDITREAYEQLDVTYDPGPLVHDPSDTELRDFLAVDRKRKFLGPIVSRLGQPCRVLDVGCGSGGYLLAAEELGCEAVGVEPSEAHSTIGRRLGLSIHNGYLTDEMFDRKSFDLVILSHVVEHIYDPKPFLESLERFLRPGGFLVVVTPNASSIIARLSRGSWVMLKPTDHVSMLSATSFVKMGLCGLQPVEFRDTEHTWEPAASLAAAARDALSSKHAFRQAAQPNAGSHAGQAPPAPRRGSRVLWSSSFRPIRSALSITGLPVHVLAKATGRQACLTAIFQKA